MFDEFGSLYRSAQDAKFTNMIEAGMDIGFKLDRSMLQEHFECASFYHSYCTQMLKHQGVFFQRRVADELGSIRHHSSADQERYDQQFALVPRS